MSGISTGFHRILESLLRLLSLFAAKPIRSHATLFLFGDHGFLTGSCRECKVQNPTPLRYSPPVAVFDSWHWMVHNENPRRQASSKMLLEAVENPIDAGSHPHTETTAPQSSADTPTHRVFHHLAAPKATVYRAILGIFVSAKERFEIALRASEVGTRLAALPEPPVDIADETEAITCLDALREWGNLTATRDIVSARTIEEYLHPKFLYQLSRQGDMAERAIAFYEEGLRRPGELSTTALREIADTLDELQRLLAASELDESNAARALTNLASHFDTLATRAQVFVAGLQRELDRPAFEESAFLALKEELLNYLERFVRELVQASYRVSRSLRLLDDIGVEPLLHAATKADLTDVLSPSPTLRTETRARWQGRWNGLYGWFIGTPGRPAQAERLRARALAAIPALLERVRRMHDQRANRADRSTDFLTLARWFAHAPTNDDLHRLWRVAFVLTSCRHLRVNATTLQAWAELDDRQRPSWEDCPPYIITIAQWRRGRSGPRGAPPSIIDRTAARRVLRERADAEARALRAARSALASLTPCFLAELPELDAPGFEVLLDAIGEAFAQIAPSETSAEATTADGGLHVRIQLPATKAELATIHTVEGILRGPDLRLTLRLTDDHATA